jgi:hypothetical protein
MANGTLTLGELNRAHTSLLCGEMNNWLVLLAFCKHPPCGGRISVGSTEPQQTASD